MQKDISKLWLRYRVKEKFMYELVKNGEDFTLLSPDGWVLTEGTKAEVYYYLQDQLLDESLILSIIG